MAFDEALVDVLVLLPEYEERNALVDSAMELVRKCTPKHFRFTLVGFPEDDPRFEDGEIGMIADSKVITHSNFLTRATFRPTVDRGFNTNFDYLDDEQTFTKRIEGIQEWLKNESEDYWYEMDRPDFQFNPAQTLGVYLNPNAHLEHINSGQLPGFQNVFFVQMSTLVNVQSELHIHLAKFLWSAPFRFLFEQKKEDLRRELSISPQIVLRDTNTARLRKLVRHWSRNTSTIAQDLCYFINMFVKGIESIDNALISLQKNVKINEDFIPTFNKEKNQLEIDELSIFIPLTLKERIVYNFMCEQSSGISPSDFITHRARFMELLLNDTDTHEGFNEESAEIILVQLSRDEELRKVVSQINCKFEPFIFIPKIRRWTIIRVGDKYRLFSKKVGDEDMSIFD